MAVRIRLKKLGRLHRPFFRICVMDSRTNRDGKTIEEIGTYDPMVRETDARVTIDAARVEYWISVGAKPTPNVQKLIEKYSGKVPSIRKDEKKVRDSIAAPAKAAARRKKIEQAQPPVPEETAAPEQVAAMDAESPAQAAPETGTPEVPPTAEASAAAE